MSTYRGTEGTRPYAGAAWYYAEYRLRISQEFTALLAERLGWTKADRILDLGAGPGHLAFLAAPFVAEVVAIEPEPDMLAEGERRKAALGMDNVTFIAASSDDLPHLRSTLGRFRTALMGQSFHWMLEKDRVLRDLSAMTEAAGGSVACVKPYRLSAPEDLLAAEGKLEAILEGYLANVPPGPHPRGRHDPFEETLRRSPFPHLETLERVHRLQIHPTVDSLMGIQYSTSYVLARLGDRRDEFEHEAHQALGDLDALGEVWITQRDEALIGRK